MGNETTPFTLGTFSGQGRAPFPALIVGEEVHPIADLKLEYAGAPLPAARLSMIDVFEVWDPIYPALVAAAGRVRPGSGVKRAGLTRHAPMLPRQIVCAGANYRKHVIDILVDHPGSGSDPSWTPEERRRRAETLMDHRAAHGQPFAFVKAQSAVLDPFADLVVPADSQELDWELELGVVIGRAARRVPRSRAFDYVAGYVVCNDISARDHISRPDIPTLGLDFLTAKSGPGFLPLGPEVVPAAFVENPQDLMITLKLNGETMQHESTDNMIFPIAHLIEYASTHMQLLPGDLLCTGSPSGNGTHHHRFLRPGDVMEGTIASVGTQRNRCVAEAVGEGAVLHRPFAALAAP